MLNAYWHSHWVQETGMFSSDKRHDIWACGSPEQCKALYGSAYTSTGGTIDPPTPVGNIAATIQAPNLSISSNGQIQNVGNVLGTYVSLTGQKLINGITTANTYTPRVNAPSQVISLSPVDLPGLNLSVPRAIGTGALPTPVAGKASYVDASLGGSTLGSRGPQDLLNNLPPSLQPSSTLFYYNPQEEDLLLQQAALKQTGKSSFVDGLTYDSTRNVSVTTQEKEYLYLNAIDYSKAHDLQLGTALTQEQINSLDKPMLWYVEQTVPDPTCHATGTASCPTITALMPQVYLPVDTQAMSAGGNISGHDVTLKFNQDGNGSILNTGSITASGTLSVDTHTLTNQANQVDVGEIWQKVDGGYLKTTGTTVQPGGFMSAVNMDLNVQTLNQIGGALQKLAADGTVDESGTQQALAALQQQLGGNFTQTALSDNLHQDFVKEGGSFGMAQIGALVAAIAVSLITYGAASAAIGATLGAEGGTFAAATAATAAAPAMSAGLGNVVLSAAIAGFTSSAASQFVGTGKIALSSAFEAAAVAAFTAGLTNGITYNAQSGLGFTTQPIALGTGTQSLASLAGVKPGIGNTASQAMAPTTTLEVRGLAMLADAGISAGLHTAIEGGSFGSALKSGLVSDLAAAGAFAIGDQANPLTLTNIVGHMTLGCVASAASGSGCGGGAIGGAVSAAFSPDVVRAIDPTGAPLDPGQQAALAAFATLAGGGLAGLAGQNAMAGATAAQNEALNNTGDHAADAAKKGGLLNAFGTWLQDTYGDPIGSFKNWGNQFLGLMQANNGQTPPSDPNPLVQANNGNPPATGGAVVTPPVVACTPGAGCVVTPPIASAGATGSPSNATLSSGNSGGGSGSGTSGQDAANASGDAARLVGQSRETSVANIVNGSISGEKVAVPGLGSTDIDVVAANGNLIAVGGPAKANNLGKLGQELRIYQTIAYQRGASAEAYFAEGTPQSAINLATKILGAGNVKIFPGSK
ncbi:DUF637 domain-containing protein [Burkholderia multivorans]|uniref:DUF637 domain-containing protein n=1 Tax=Burkholderia multivorans TaxID=87883 RepID=UPI002FC287F8